MCIFRWRCRQDSTNVEKNLGEPIRANEVVEQLERELIGRLSHQTRCPFGSRCRGWASKKPRRQSGATVCDLSRIDSSSVGVTGGPP
jgi:hypothetical protein